MESYEREKLNEVEKLRSLITEELEKKGKPAERTILEDLSDESVLIFGEGHGEDFRSLRSILYNLLPALKEKGVTTLAVEYDITDQESLDRYSQGKLSAEEMAGKFIISPVLYKEVTKDWTALLERCKELGLSVKAVDFAPLSEAEEQGQADYENRRDRTMFEELRKLSMTGQKTVYIVGNRHLATEPELAPDGKKHIRRLGNRIRDEHLNWILIEGVASSTRLTQLAGRSLSEIGVLPAEGKLIRVQSSNKVFKEGIEGRVNYILITPPSRGEI